MDTLQFIISALLFIWAIDRITNAISGKRQLVASHQTYPPRYQDSPN